MMNYGEFSNFIYRRIFDSFVFGDEKSSKIHPERPNLKTLTAPHLARWYFPSK